MSFKRLDPEDFLISADSITAGAWTGNTPTLSNFATNSAQESGTSGQYYLDVYQTGSGEPGAEVQFSISYGNKFGSGSLLFDSGITGKSPTSAIYGQFQNIVLGDENSDFIFGGETKTDFYAISINRSKYKGSLLPGSLNITIGGKEFTDNSNDSSTVLFNEAGRVYQIVSGSNGSAHSGDGYSPNSGSYGLFLPDIGTILLNPDALDESTSIVSTGRASNTNNENPVKLYEALEEFTVNSQENITSDYIFVRARNGEYNYSENPSFISGSTGEVLYPQLINSPQTFITTVGLYNDANELLAVAKLSKPLKKDFTKEALIRVKLDF